jgi:hypothetical protein
MCLMIDAYRANAKLTANNPLFIEHGDSASAEKPIGPHDVELDARQSESDSSSENDDEPHTRKTLTSIPLPPMIQPADDQPPLQKSNSTLLSSARKADQSPRWSGRPPAFVPVQRLPLPLPSVVRSGTLTTPSLASPRDTRPDLVPHIPVVSNQSISANDALTFSCDDEPSPRLGGRSPRLHSAQSMSALPDVASSPSFINRSSSVPSLPATLPSVIDSNPTLAHSTSAATLDSNILPVSIQPTSPASARNMSLPDEEPSSNDAQPPITARLATFNRDKIFRRPSTLPPKRGFSLPAQGQPNSESQ